MGIVLWIIILLLLTSQLFLIIKFVKEKNRYYLGSVIWCLSLLILLLLISAVLQWVKIPEYVLILIMATLFIHNYIGYYKNQYNESKMFDRLLHCLGSFSFALLFYYIIIDLTKAQTGKIFMMIFVFVLGIALGTLFELLEYFKDKKNSIKAQKGLNDTNVDLLCDVIGSAFAAAVYCFFIIP
jgi:hypothetical protein